MDAYKVIVEIRNETDDYILFHPWEPIHGEWHTAAGADIIGSDYVKPGTTGIFTLADSGVYGAEGSFTIRLVAEDGAPGVMYELQAHAACPVFSDNVFSSQWNVIKGAHAGNDFLEVESGASAGGKGVTVNQTLSTSGNPVQILYVLRKVEATMPLDVWGEGRMQVSGTLVGFEQAYNLNLYTKGQGPQNKTPIPNRIAVPSWAPDVLPIPSNTIRQMASMNSPLDEPGVVLGMSRILHRTDPAARIYLYNDTQKAFHSDPPVPKPGAPVVEEPFREKVRRMENWAAFEAWLERLAVLRLVRLHGPVDARTLPAPFNEIRLHALGKDGKPSRITWAWVYGFA